MNEERDVDTLAGKGSVAGKIKEQRKYKKSRLDEIMSEGNMQTTRGTTPPQYGQNSHETQEKDEY